MKASLISKFNIYLCKGIIILISCFLQFFPSKKVSLTGKNPNLQRLVCWQYVPLCALRFWQLQLHVACISIQVLATAPTTATAAKTTTAATLGATVANELSDASREMCIEATPTPSSSEMLTAVGAVSAPSLPPPSVCLLPLLAIASGNITFPWRMHCLLPLCPFSPSLSLCLPSPLNWVYDRAQHVGNLLCRLPLPEPTHTLTHTDSGIIIAHSTVPQSSCNRMWIGLGFQVGVSCIVGVPLCCPPPTLPPSLPLSLSLSQTRPPSMPRCINDIWPSFS